MSLSVARILAFLGIIVLLVSAVCLIYPLVRARAPWLGKLTQALIFTVAVGAPLAILGAYVVAPLRPLVDSQALQDLRIFPAGQALASFLISTVLDTTYEVTPNLWTGLGTGAGIGMALAIAVRGLLATSASPSSGASTNDEPPTNEALPGFIWGVLLLVGAVVVPIVAVTIFSSLTPSMLMQLGPDDELATGFILGIACGFLIASGAASLVDIAGAVLARIVQGERGASSQGRATEARGIASVISRFSGAIAPVMLWITLGVIVIVWQIAGSARAHNWGGVVGWIVISPIVLVFIIWPGLLQGLASALRTALAGSAGERTIPLFDGYLLLGGVIFGLLLALGSYIPLLGWLLGVIGTLGWPGLLIGIALGLVLAAWPLISRTLTALPNLVWIAFACVLVAAGGILALMPAWLT